MVFANFSYSIAVLGNPNVPLNIELEGLTEMVWCTQSQSLLLNILNLLLSQSVLVLTPCHILPLWAEYLFTLAAMSGRNLSDM